MLKATEIENQLKALAQKVYAHRLFDRFVEGSWSPAIERNFRKQVWPLTICTVADLWWTAMRTSSHLRYTPLPHPQHWQN